MKAIDNPELSELLCRELHAEDFESVIGLIDAHTAAAVAAERESCAKVCEYIASQNVIGSNDSYRQGREMASQVCAIQIRARGEYE